MRFLILEPLSEGESDGLIARYLLVLVEFHPIEIAVETVEKGVGEAQADDAGTAMFLTWHRVILSARACEFDFQSYCITVYIYL